MAGITLYKPDGKGFTYCGVTNVTNNEGVLTFHSRTDASSINYRKITTSLPFL
jgi:hypothetical protein